LALIIRQYFIKKASIDFYHASIGRKLSVIALSYPSIEIQFLGFTHQFKLFTTPFLIPPGIIPQYIFDISF